MHQNDWIAAVCRDDPPGDTCRTDYGWVVDSLLTSLSNASCLTAMWVHVEFWNCTKRNIRLLFESYSLFFLFLKLTMRMKIYTTFSRPGWHSWLSLSQPSQWQWLSQKCELGARLSSLPTSFHLRPLSFFLLTLPIFSFFSLSFSPFP